MCVGSPFDVLLPSTTGDGFTQGWRLDDSAKAQVVALAKAQGICDACDGGGTIERGLYISLTAEIIDLGNSTQPPTISAVGAVSLGTAGNMTSCPGGSAYPQSAPAPVDAAPVPVPVPAPTAPAPVDTAPAPAPVDAAPASDPGDVLTLEPGFTLGIVNNGDNTASYTLAYEGEGWIGFGVSPDGEMIFSQTVIGLPGAGEDPVIYNLAAKDISGVVPAKSDQQILTSSSITQENGITTLTFTVPLESDAPFSVSASGDTGYVYAYGSSNELGYHAARGALSASIAPAAPAPGGTPTSDGGSAGDSSGVRSLQASAWKTCTGSLLLSVTSGLLPFIL
jgi:DOMON domain